MEHVAKCEGYLEEKKDGKEVGSLIGFGCTKKLNKTS